MGIEVVSVEPGKSLLKMQVRPDMHNGVGWLQGGMLAAIADEAMAPRIDPLLLEQEGIATITDQRALSGGPGTG